MKKKFAKTMKRLIILGVTTGVLSFIIYWVVFNYGGYDPYRKAEMWATIVGAVGAWIGVGVILYYPILWVFKNAKD